MAYNCLNKITLACGTWCKFVIFTLLTYLPYGLSLGLSLEDN